MNIGLLSVTLSISEFSMAMMKGGVTRISLWFGVNVIQLLVYYVKFIEDLLLNSVLKLKLSPRPIVFSC